MSTPEKKIQNSIIKHLRKNGWFCFSIFNGAVFDTARGIHRSQGYGSIRGVPDICAMKRDTKHGIEQSRFLWIEVKTPKGTQSPDQKLFEEYCTLHGFEYILARSIDDVIAKCD